MRYRLGVEDIEPGHWIAWALDLPGCFSSGSTEQAAVQGAPHAIAAFQRWRSEHGRPLVFPADSLPDVIEIEVDEVFHAYKSADEYVVNAFFADDQRPLTAADVTEACWLLSCTRRDLLAVLDGIPRMAWESAHSDELDSLAGILHHIAVAERWYFGRVGLDQPPQPEDPVLALEQTRAHSLRCLDMLAGDSTVHSSSGERWSARKVVRRTLWHERDHTGQIKMSLRV